MIRLPNFNEKGISFSTDIFKSSGIKTVKFFLN